jgi:hypothetical protein
MHIRSAGPGWHPPTFRKLPVTERTLDAFDAKLAHLVFHWLGHMVPRVREGSLILNGA